MAGLPLSYDYIYIFTHIEVELSNTDCALEFSQVAFVNSKIPTKGHYGSCYYINI